MLDLNLIREAIAGGKLEHAVSLLLENYKGKERKDNVVLLSGRYHNFQEKVINGLMNTQDEVVAENQISYAVLNLLNLIEEDFAIKSLALLDVKSDEKVVVEKLLEILNEGYKGFKSQSSLRNALYRKMTSRLEFKGGMEYEEFFKSHHSKMNEEELEYHKSIRDYTEKILNKYNRKALEVLLGNNNLKDRIPKLVKLERHLLVWLGKYEQVFKNTPALNILYVGVAEKVPFPRGVEGDLEEYLAKGRE